MAAPRKPAEEKKIQFSVNTYKIHFDLIGVVNCQELAKKAIEKEFKKLSKKV